MRLVLLPDVMISSGTRATRGATRQAGAAFEPAHFACGNAGCKGSHPTLRQSPPITGCVSSTPPSVMMSAAMPHRSELGLIPRVADAAFWRVRRSGGALLRRAQIFGLLRLACGCAGSPPQHLHRPADVAACHAAPDR
jgi:hypothetical protein